METLRFKLISEMDARTKHVRLYRTFKTAIPSLSRGDIARAVSITIAYSGKALAETLLEMMDKGLINTPSPEANDERKEAR